MLIIIQMQITENNTQLRIKTIQSQKIEMKQNLSTDWSGCMDTGDEMPDVISQSFQPEKLFIM